MDDEAFTALFRAHHGAVLAYARRRSDPDTAWDVAAETFLVAWRRLETPPQQPLPWLLAVARRVLANEQRRAGRAGALHQRAARAATTGGVPTALMAVPDHAEELTQTQHLRQAMDQLGLRDQEVLQLAGWEELDHTGIAAVLGCSPAAARVRLHRARRRLSALLQRPPDQPLEPRRGHTRTSPGRSRGAVPLTPLRATPLPAPTPTTAPAEDLR